MTEILIDYDALKRRAAEFGFRRANFDELQSGLALAEHLTEQTMATPESIRWIDGMTGMAGWVTGDPVEGVFITVPLSRDGVAAVRDGSGPKGDVLATARIAGIMAAKRTGELIPLCHPLPLTHCEVQFQIPPSRDRICITASAKIAAQTGIEMEALTAVSVAALTIYDMCKAADKSMRITDVALVSKTKQPLPPPLP